MRHIRAGWGLEFGAIHRSRVYGSLWCSDGAHHNLRRARLHCYTTSSKERHSAPFSQSKHNPCMCFPLA